MNRERFVAERQHGWAELDGLVLGAGRRASSLGPDGVRRLGVLYRSTAADLAAARRCFPGDPLVAGLEGRVAFARQLVYGGEHRRLSARDFLATRYWQRVRERPGFLLAAFLLLFVPALLAGTWAVRDPGRAQGLVPVEARGVTSRDSADFGLGADERAAAASQIFTNNIRVTFLAFAGGIVFALGAAVVLIQNAVILGTVFGLTYDAGNGLALTEFVLPHGILELSCIVVAAAAGMRMGWALVAPGRRRRGDALKAEAGAAVEVIVGTAVVLVVCGLVEGLLSTTGLGIGAALVVGVGLGAIFWLLVWWRGAPDPALDDDREDDGTAERAARELVYRRVASPAVRPLDTAEVTAVPAPSL